jgi:alpha-ketoglutaric semialdehyde dehydrogenase
MSETVGAPAHIAHHAYIGGSWRQAALGETYEKRNPMRPSEVVGTFPACDEPDVDDAVRGADDAFAEWAATPAAQRGNVLAEAATVLEGRVEQIAQDDMAREMGKPLPNASRADDDGFVIEPSVFEDVADDAYLSCEEVFAP